MLLLVGEKDKLTDLEANERTAGLIPDARMASFPGDGHCTLPERRFEFNEEPKRFLLDVFSGYRGKGWQEPHAWEDVSHKW